MDSIIFKQFSNLFPADHFQLPKYDLEIIFLDDNFVEISGEKIKSNIKNDLKILVVTEYKFYNKRTVRGFTLFGNSKVSLNLVYGSHYRFRVYTNLNTNENKFDSVYIKHFHCIYSKEKILELYRRACERFSTIKTKDTKINYLYRCKSSIYFKNIEKLNDGIMGLYKKDNTGHPGNPIIGNLKGIFFSGKLDDKGKIPDRSPYGDKRFVIKAHSLLNPSRYNYYFNDIYCNKNTSNHNVTIVVCRKDSKYDKFCKEKLVKLDPKNNMFLFYTENNGKLEYYCNWGKKDGEILNIEIFYCDFVSTKWGKFENVGRLTGGGTTTPGGIMYNKKCDFCKL